MMKGTGGGKKIEQVSFRHLKNIQWQNFFLALSPKHFIWLWTKYIFIHSKLSPLTALFFQRRQISVKCQTGLDGTVPFFSMIFAVVLLPAKDSLVLLRYFQWLFYKKCLYMPKLLCLFSCQASTLHFSPFNIVLFLKISSERKSVSPS